MEKLWTLKEFASFVGLSYGHAIRLARKGKFNRIGRKVGHQWRFHPDTVKEYYANKT